MANQFFEFKQFRIEQAGCAMKVSTDACLLGAWLTEKIKPGSSVLDIGSGTGLLLLMLAQNNNGQMEGIELEQGCFRQLEENIRNSPWQDRIQAIHGDVRNFLPEVKYDFIISNPPFYENDLRSPSQSINLAKHSAELSLEELIIAIRNLLNVEGSFGVLLPYHRSNYFEFLATAHGFYLKEKLDIRQSAQHGFFRSILHFSRERSTEINEYALTIHAEQNRYTPEFISLLKDYYLHL